MILLPTLKDKEDDQLAFPMGNCYSKANISYPSLNIQIYYYNTSFVLSEKPPLFQTLNVSLFPAWASFLASDEQRLGLRNQARLCPLHLGLPVYGTLGNWIMLQAILAPRVKRLLPFFFLSVLCATLSYQELPWKILFVGLHGTGAGTAGTSVQYRRKWELLQWNV